MGEDGIVVRACGRGSKRVAGLREGGMVACAGNRVEWFVKTKMFIVVCTEYWILGS